MRSPPAIDTLEATRALVKAGLDQAVAEELIRVINSGISDSAARATELAEMRTFVIRSELRTGTLFAVIVTLLAGLIALARHGQELIDSLI